MQTHAYQSANARGPSPPLAMGRSPHLHALLRQAYIKPKLIVGAVNDPAEAEADRIADQVMRMPDPVAMGKAGQSVHGILHRKCPTCEEEDKLHRKESPNPASSAGGPLSPEAEAIVGNIGPGTPLPLSERRFFEPRFGHSLEHVRIHDGADAARAAGSINARAFAHGSSVVFGSGEFGLGATSGRKLLAHELAHVGRSQIFSKTIKRATTPKNSMSLVLVMMLRLSNKNKAMNVIIPNASKE